jgi:hypothetical protein
MAELNCNIEVDFSFEQTDCHWELTRFFRLTWNKADGKSLMYRLDTAHNADKFLGYKLIEADQVYTERDSYIYEIPFSKFTSDEIAAARAYDPDNSGDYGWITFSVSNSIGTSKKTFKKFYFLELPPVITKAKNEKVINTDFVIENPGEIKVSWKHAIELDGSDAENSPDDLDGYSIEVFHCPKDPKNPNKHLDQKNFVRLDGLRWHEVAPGTNTPADEYEAYKYTLVRDSVNIEVNAPEVLEGEEEISSYVDLNPGSEVYIERPLLVNTPKTEFFFNPKHLDIKPSDHYKFVIRPYSHYGSASLISNEGVESEVYKVRPGFVHVKTVNGWEAGQVWVYANTKDGPKWVVAESVYTKTADGWKEAI